MQDLNLRPPACRAEALASQVILRHTLTEPLSSACTPACTETASKAHDDPLAAFVGHLTPADRARLAALLAGSGEEVDTIEGSHPDGKTGLDGAGDMPG